MFVCISKNTHQSYKNTKQKKATQLNCEIAMTKTMSENEKWFQDFLHIEWWMSRIGSRTVECTEKKTYKLVGLNL